MSRRRIDPTPSPESSRRSAGGSRRATPATIQPPHGGGMFSNSDRTLLAIATSATIAAGVFHSSNGPVVAFIVAGIALASLASLVGRCVEAIGDKLGPGPTGVLQSFLANLPEIFVIMFSLKAGLYDVVKATIVGSVLANVLLVAGLAYLVGGLKNGRQRFSETASRQLGLMLLLSVSVLAIPTLTSALHTPAADHERVITVVISIVLLALFAASLPDILRTGQGATTSSVEAMQARSETEHHGAWSLTLGLTLLTITAIASALVSDWFVSALSPAMDTLHINPTFAGLIIVAIAGNAVENFVGIQLCARNKPEYALQIVLQSPVQVAMIVAPLIALAAPLVGAATFTLTLTPMLLASLILATLVTVVVVEDGETTWFEGAALLALYVAIACAFWWG